MNSKGKIVLSFQLSTALDAEEILGRGDLILIEEGLSSFGQS